MTFAQVPQNKEKLTLVQHKQNRLCSKKTVKLVNVGDARATINVYFCYQFWTNRV